MSFPTELPPAAVSLQTVMAARQSCRGFLPRQVPRATLDAMLAMAQASPSWCNVQPWQLILTSGAATDRLRAALAPRIGHPPASDLPFPDKYVGDHLERGASAPGNSTKRSVSPGATAPPRSSSR